VKEKRREAYQSQKEVPWAMKLLPIPLLCKVTHNLLKLIKRNRCFFRNPSHVFRAERMKKMMKTEREREKNENEEMKTASTSLYKKQKTRK